MAQTGVRINWINKPSGIPTPNIGVCGILTLGVAVTGKVQLKTLYTLTKLSDAVALGIDAAYDTANDVLIYYNISQFYSKAQDGSILYLYLIDKATATMSTFIGTEDFDTMLLETAQSGGSPSPNTAIRMLGVLFPTDTAAPTGTDVFYSDVKPTITALQSNIESFQTNNGWSPAVAIVDGNNLKNVSSCLDFSQLSSNICSCSISNLNGSVCGEIGYPLGVLSLYPTQYNLGDGQYGAITDVCYFTDGTEVSSYAQGVFSTLGTKQALFIRTKPGAPNFWYNDSPTCDLNTLDFSTIQAQRLKNLVTQIVGEYAATLINTGISKIGNNADPNALLQYKTVLENQLLPLINNNTGVNGNVLGAGEISNVVVTFDGTNFRNTKKLSATVVVNNTLTINIINITGSFGAV